MKQSGVARVTVSLDPADVDLLDRLAALEGKNRSYELRAILSSARPILTATVEALEAAQRQREHFDEAVKTGLFSDLEALLPEVERLHSTYVGAMSRLEGKAAADAAADPRRSNHGGHTPTPTSPPAPDEGD